MGEQLRRSVEKVRSAESIRVRLDVRIGMRGDFDAQKRAASREGVETLDPVHSGLSSVSHLSKRSQDYTTCLGIIAIGKGSDGRNLSFTTHQIPSAQEKFIQEYEAQARARLEEFGAETLPGTGDIVLFTTRDAHEAHREWAQQLKERMAQVVRKSGGREPRILDDINGEFGHVDVFLDTAGAALYIERY